MGTDEEGFDIHENHRRGISSTLGILDRALCDFRRWAEGHESSSSLFHERNNLTDPQRVRILEVTADIQGLIQEIRDRLDLHGFDLEVGRVISVQCAFLWEDLVELQGHRLGRYGKPDPGLTRYLDPRVQAIIDRLMDVASVAGRETTSEATSEHLDG